MIDWKAEAPARQSWTPSVMKHESPSWLGSSNRPMSGDGQKLCCGLRSASSLGLGSPPRGLTRHRVKYKFYETEGAPGSRRRRA
jgi:hypothetical protein